MNIFLTGTDTGVGKTFTAVQLLRVARGAGLRCVGMKPICCGDRHDAELLLAASSEVLTIDEVNPVWLRTPAAPFAASLIEQVTVEPARLIEAFERLRKRFDFVVVEGVGGWLVPIQRDYFVSDLAVEMKSPVIVVVRNRLGCLNHTMLTLRSIAASGLDCAGIVWNDAGGTADIAATTNADILQRLGVTPILTQLTENIIELPAAWQAILAWNSKPSSSA